MAERHVERQPGAERLVVALDVADLPAAVATATAVAPYFATAKVGLELFSAAGPEAISELSTLGYRIFLDLKLHDIPTTVGRAASVIGGLGVDLVTVHTAGGADMLTAAVEGIAAGAATAGHQPAGVLGVTVLTSDPDADPAVVAARARLAGDCGCRGVVCAASDLAVVRAETPDLRTMVPGIRPAGSATNDQARVATPAAAITAGADQLVIGRAVTASGDPVASAAAVATEVASALGTS
jgi:orotidine-5'-phosphate decarboxylase